MNAIAQLPFELRLIGLLAIGLALGSLVNWAIYAMAFDRRPISPWMTPHPKAPPRHWSDRLPIVGWWGLRREAKLHGPGFWLRPMLIEVALALGLPWLYAYESGGGLLFPPINPRLMLAAELNEMLHAQFLAHAVLFVLLVVATFIDFDEKTIPDAITVPGVLLALLIVSIWPTALMPVPRYVPLLGGYVASPLWLTWNPGIWPEVLSGPRGLALGLLGYLGWCLAVTPAIVTSRRGLVKGVQFFAVSILRSGTWRIFVGLAVIGLVAIPIVWSIGGKHWQGMLTSIVGMVAGGGLVWTIRIVASGALKKEAMGFGDVTLMAMIGAFLGWQATWMVFFLSPLAAVVIASINWLITRRRDLPFGPYLALAAVVVVIRWGWLWTHYADAIFSLGWFLVAILGACLMLLMGMLMLWRIVEDWLYREEG